MKNLLILIFFFTFIILSCGSEKHVPRLLTDYFNYSPEMTAKMKNLSLQIRLLDPDNEITVAETSKFEITNKYLFPFIFEILKRSKKEFSKEELIQAITNLAYEKAMNMLLQSEAEEKGFSVSSEEINKKLIELKSYEAEIQKEQIDKTVFKSEFVYENLKQALIIEKYKNSLIKEISITGLEIEDFYNNNPALSFIDKRAVVRHIYVSVNKLNEKDKKRKREKIDNILNEIKNGKKFEELAFKYSDDPATYNNGGKLGDFVEKGQMTQEIDQLIFSLKPGETSGVVEAESGFHIFKVEEIFDENKKSIEDLKENIKKILIHEKSNRIIKDEKLRIENKYKLKIFI
jgi:parvulin-like peptidyl-prolyl isomerase